MSTLVINHRSSVINDDTGCDSCKATTMLQNIAQEIVAERKPTPLGQPVWNFEPEQPSKSGQQQRSRRLVNNSDLPTPLGQPVWRF